MRALGVILTPILLLALATIGGGQFSPAPQVANTPTPLPHQFYLVTSGGQTVLIERSLTTGDIGVTIGLIVLASVVFIIGSAVVASLWLGSR